MVVFLLPTFELSDVAAAVAGDAAVVGPDKLPLVGW